MGHFDLVIRNGTVVTTADEVRCDVGIRDGKVVALADELESGDREIDAENMQGKILELPTREDIRFPIQEQLIVELYSR